MPGYQPGEDRFKSFVAADGSHRRELPDASLSLRVTAQGALLTGALFTLGKLLLKSLLVSSNIQHLYGTAGAFVVVLLFVFYIALILYYGAAVTAVLADRRKESTRSKAIARETPSFFRNLRKQRKK